jgi:hypothetical protein
MALQNKAKAIPMTTFNGGALSGSYQAINTSGFPEACFLIRIVNDNSTNITISYDGINDHDQLAGTIAGVPRETLVIDLTSNPALSGYLFFAKGTIVYVKGSAGAGSIYLSGYYQDVAGR